MRKSIIGLFICSMVLLWLSVPVKGGEVEEEKEQSILVIENSAKDGRVELLYEGELYYVNSDYFELEVTQDSDLLLRIIPKPRKSVENIVANDVEIPSENGVCTLKMKEEFLFLTVSYCEVKTSEADEGSSLVSDNQEYYSAAVAGRDENYVSDITYDVTVTYLNGDAEQEEQVAGNIAEKEQSLLPEVESFYENEDIKGAESNYDGEETLTVLVEEEAAELSISDEITKTVEETEEIISEPLVENNTNKIPVDNGEKAVVTKGKEAKTALSKNIDEVRSKPVVKTEENLEGIGRKSILFLSNLPLYLFVVCCMMLLKRFIKTDEKG